MTDISESNVTIMIELEPLKLSDREQFISDNQEAFNYGALEEFGLRDDHFEEEGQIISRETIEKSIDGGEAYRIMQDGQPVGGVIIKVDGERGDLDILFVSPGVHSKGIVLIRRFIILGFVIRSTTSHIVSIAMTIMNHHQSDAQKQERTNGNNTATNHIGIAKQ